MIYQKGTKAHLLTQFMRLGSRVLACLVSAIAFKHRCRFQSQHAPVGFTHKGPVGVGGEIKSGRDEGRRDENYWHIEQEIGTFFLHLLAGHELSFEPSGHVAHIVILEPLQPSPWNFGTAEWKSWAAQELSRPHRGPYRSVCLSFMQVHLSQSTSSIAFLPAEGASSPDAAEPAT